MRDYVVSVTALTVFAVLALTLISFEAVAQNQWILKENGIGGRPSALGESHVLTEQDDGSYRVRRSSALGQERALEKGHIITLQSDGSYKVQKESPFRRGRADPYDRGYTLQQLQ